jgi:transcriptional regulator with XRE-family HTH domain
MEHLEPKYNNLFTVEERKKIIAQSMAELRKNSGLSQKEAAATIGISQATYSAYERGRNEPPAEILVRLSYLFKCPIDILVQRDRIYRDANDALKQAEQLKAKMLQLEEDFAKNGGENETAKAMLEVMKKMGEALVQTAQRPDIAAKLNDPLR